MKILITSDSHGLEKELLELVERHKHDVETFIHCGDSELASDSAEMTPYLAVKGNCDSDAHYRNDLITEVDSIKVFVTHGHLYNVKMTAMNLLYKAEECAANIICFGHTHVAGSFKEGDHIFINPGSLRLPRNIEEKTYVICDIDSERMHVDVSYFSYEGNRLEALCESYHLEPALP